MFWLKKHTMCTRSTKPKAVQRSLCRQFTCEVCCHIWRFRRKNAGGGGEIARWRIFCLKMENFHSGLFTRSTHIVSDDGELPLIIFHSLNEANTSTCLRCARIAKLNISKTKISRNWLLANRIAEQLPELAASWPQFCLRTVCGS